MGPDYGGLRGSPRSTFGIILRYLRSVVNLRDIHPQTVVLLRDSAFGQTLANKDHEGSEILHRGILGRKDGSVPTTLAKELNHRGCIPIKRSCWSDVMIPRSYPRKNYLYPDEEL
jgi:hypothetical protein